MISHAGRAMRSLISSGTTIVAPSILAADIMNLGRDAGALQQAGSDWLHVDVMDSHFVPPITFGDNVVRGLRASLPNTFLDVHLMVREPERSIGPFCEAGASLITVHQEACPHLHRTLSQIREAGRMAGVSINPGTPVESVFDVLEQCDLVLVMSVNPGYGGQSFIPQSVSKIRRLASELKRRGLSESVAIEVDGGINQSTAQQCVEAGARVLVAGSYVFKHASMRDAINSLRMPLQ